MNTMVESIRGMGQMKLAALAGAAVLLIAFFIFISLRVASPVMSPLYTNISMEDSGSIVAELEKNGTPYELSSGGTQILVPTDQVLRLRMSMAQQGLPSSGSVIGYEIFDHSEALGTSNFVLNVNKLRALEGELSRTIGSFNKVENARVHLVLPKRELFTREREEPSASVALKVRGELSREEIAAIRHLVATAVPRLKPTRITIVDEKGRLLARGYEDENDPEALAATAQEFRNGFERKTKTTIERLLEQSVGLGKVRAEVNADIDFDRIETNSEKFDPEGQVARSVQSVNEEENTNERDLKDNVTVGNNLPDVDPNNAGILSTSQIQRSDETTNFEISKVVQNHVKQTGSVNRLSVAVLVDGVYTEGEDGAKTYAPRSEEELAQLQKLVESAIGFDSERGDTVEVVNMQFANANEDLFENSAFDWLKQDLNSIIQTIVLGGVAVLVILLIVRPLVARTIMVSEEAEQDSEFAQSLLDGPSISGALPDLTGEDDDDELVSLERVKGGVKSSTYRKINEMIEKHPEEALGILRGWAFAEAE